MKRIVAAVLLIGMAVMLSGANWPNWRGPTNNGVAPPGEYPTQWNDKENVVWKLALPGRGASTPIVWNKQLYLTYGKGGQNALACVDWDGKLKWETILGSEKPGKNKKGTGSNPSAITDGKLLFAYFKSGDLACVDFQGKTIWHKNLPKEYNEDELWKGGKTDPLWWDLGSSPVLTKNCVVVTVMQSGPSYLVAFDKASGKEIWKADRNLDAPSEAAQSYTTPVLVTDESGKETVYVLGADHITAHDGATGKELWRVGGLNPTRHGYFRSIASPVISGEILVGPYARGSSLTAVRLGGKGDVTKTHVAWFKDDLGADVPTPAAKDGRIYVCTDRGEVACLDAASGKQIWKEKVEPNRNAFSSSPILAGDKIYVTREDGKTFVLKQGDKFELIAANELPNEYTVSTPVFVDGRIFIRTFENLYCIGK